MSTHAVNIRLYKYGHEQVKSRKKEILLKIGKQKVKNGGDSVVRAPLIETLMKKTVITTKL